MAFAVGGGRKGAPRGEINVTPLIDIVLVLLIIFMVMTPVMLKEIVAKVPEKQTELTPQPPGENPIVVELSSSDALTLNSEPVSPDDLPVKIAERLQHDRQKVVFFRIDDHANYGRAVRIMDICKGVGAKTLGIVTKSDK
ncbi:MAG TPA: biopolymer transporter ExbD [Polyangia bacterium]|jgi:biopolymer transport protein TolR|nr:biopolymer transporter ExbD [Polyangia bacterium]